MGMRDASATGIREEPLAAMLLRFRQELGEIAQAIEAVEQVLVEPQDDLAVCEVAVLQGLDLAVQRIRGLADFAAALSADVSHDWLVDTTTAMSLLKLGDLQRRLQASDEGPAVRSDDRAVGDVDLF